VNHEYKKIKFLLYDSLTLAFIYQASMDVQFGELLEREQYMLIPRLRNNGKVEIWLNKLQLKIKKQIEDKIDSEVYTFEHNNTCVICGSVNSTLIGERDRYGLFYPVNICQSCGFVFVNPRLNQKSSIMKSIESYI
jgi:hypothetical protein